MEFGRIVATEPLQLRRIAIVETPLGARYFYIMRPDAPVLPDGLLVRFDIANTAINVRPEEIPNRVEILRGQDAMEAWASETKDIRDGNIQPNKGDTNELL